MNLTDLYFDAYDYTLAHWAEWLQDYAQPAALIVLGVLLLWLLVMFLKSTASYCFFKLRKWTWGKIKKGMLRKRRMQAHMQSRRDAIMAGKARRWEEVGKLIADDLTEVFTRRVINDELSKDEVNFIYRRLAELFHFKDLMTSPEGLKRIIKERLDSGFYQDRAPLPDGKDVVRFRLAAIAGNNAVRKAS